MIEDKELLELCNKHLSYNPETGIFIWLTSRRVKKGSEAGSDFLGYNRIKLKGSSYMAHRLAFLITYEYMPAFVDHKDTIRNHNWIKNLRECTRYQNGYNRGPKKNNTSGYKGVTKKCLRWQSKISFEGKEIYLGLFICKHEAALAYNEAAKKYHGEFAYLNTLSQARNN